MRTALLRNLSTRYPAVRLLRAHDLLAPRYGWHQQDCRARVEASRRGEAAGRAGCDCTHYCFSPTFWRVYLRALVDELRAAQRHSA